MNSFGLNSLLLISSSFPMAFRYYFWSLVGSDTMKNKAKKREDEREKWKNCLCFSHSPSMAHAIYKYIID